MIKDVWVGKCNTRVHEDTALEGVGTVGYRTDTSSVDRTDRGPAEERLCGRSHCRRGGICGVPSAAAGDDKCVTLHWRRDAEPHQRCAQSPRAPTRQTLRWDTSQPRVQLPILDCLASGEYIICFFYHVILSCRLRLRIYIDIVRYIADEQRVT